MIHYAPTLTIINYSVIFIFLVAVALAAMSSLSDSLLTTLFFYFVNIVLKKKWPLGPVENKLWWPKLARQPQKGMRDSGHIANVKA